MRYGQPRGCSLRADGNELVFVSHYDPALVADLKAQIPATDRRWDGAAKAWRVLPTHGPTCARLAAQYGGGNITVPSVKAQAAPIETRLLEVRYVGMTKERGGVSRRSAFGLVASQWSLVLPEDVLRLWFCSELRPNEDSSLYNVLGVQPTASDADLKSAYRRLARQWHPDVCRELDAAEQFKAINHAYTILSDSTLRVKYQAGLSLSMATGSAPKHEDLSTGYRSPLRCGLIMADGRESMGRFVAERILAWEDIIDDSGAVLVVSWPVGATEPVEEWIR